MSLVWAMEEVTNACTRVKINPNGSFARLKARLMAKDYAQTYGVDYSNTFSLVAKLTFVPLFIS